jgi:hypothetical protein
MTNVIPTDLLTLWQLAVEQAWIFASRQRDFIILCRMNQTNLTAVWDERLYRTGPPDPRNALRLDIA